MKGYRYSQELEKRETRERSRDCQQRTQSASSRAHAGQKDPLVARYRTMLHTEPLTAHIMESCLIGQGHRDAIARLEDVIFDLDLDLYTNRNSAPLMFVGFESSTANVGWWVWRSEVLRSSGPHPLLND